MPVVRWKWDEAAPGEVRGALLTVGNFDGVHRGHAALLARLRAHAADLGCPAVAVTFDPHPLLLLHPESYQPTLTTPSERARLLEECGADHVIILRTEPGLLKLSAADFFERVLCGTLQARGLVEGPNFGFGRNREGTVETLARFCTRAGLVLEIVPPLTMDGGVVSSSRVRRALLAGDVASAARWLGRPYRLAGVVSAGQRRGQTLGFPTANLTQIATVIPGDGVYAVRAWLPSATPARGSEQRWRPAAANIGPNPTFGEQARKVEVHLLDFQGDLYGRTLAVDFLAKLRETQPFDSVDHLLAQIRADVAKVRALINAAPSP